MVLEEFKEIGMDMLHPIEAPPMGDCTLTQAREVLGENVVFVGNVQVGDIFSKSKEELRQIRTENILAEPCARNTAACIAYACWRIAARHPDANIVVTPSANTAAITIFAVPVTEASSRSMYVP